MILFIILLFTLIFITMVTILAISAGGAAIIILFGDVIVCGAIIIWIMKRIIHRKRR